MARPKKSLIFVSYDEASYIHSINIRTVSLYHLLLALLNQFELEHKPFGQSNMHRTLNFFRSYPGSNQLYQNLSSAKVYCPDIYTVMTADQMSFK